MNEDMDWIKGGKNRDVDRVNTIQKECNLLTTNAKGQMVSRFSQTSSASKKL